MPDHRRGPEEHRDSPGSDRSHPSQERLRAHLDGRLEERDDVEVAQHLDVCAHCTEALDAVADLDEAHRPIAGDQPGGGQGLEVPAFDERRMRRAVRRTLFATAWRAALLVVVGAVALQFLGALVIQPVAIDRGDRVGNAITASIDLPVLTIPGAQVRETVSNMGVVRRATEVTVEREVGSQSVLLGSYETRVGPLGISTSDASLLGPSLRDGDHDRTQAMFDPERLGTGTAVTVELVGLDGMAVGEVDPVAVDRDELALLWVGFDLPTPVDDEVPASVGYSACSIVPDMMQDPSWGGFGMSGGFRTIPPAPGGGATHALEQLRRATANLADTGWFDPASLHGSHPFADLEGTVEWLSDHDPAVGSIVVTGPLETVTELVEEFAPDHANLLEVDFDRGAPLHCG